MNTHYTAVVEIIEVETQDTTLAGRPDPRRARQEVARVVVRDDTLPGLVDKVQRHLAVIVPNPNPVSNPQLNYPPGVRGVAVKDNPQA